MLKKNEIIISAEEIEAEELKKEMKNIRTQSQTMNESKFTVDTFKHKHILNFLLPLNHTLYSKFY